MFIVDLSTRLMCRHYTASQVPANDENRSATLISGKNWPGLTFFPIDAFHISDTFAALFNHSKDGTSMHETHEMKGPETPLLTVLTNESAIALSKYADGSTNIMRNGCLMGIWEPTESDECYSTFLRFLARDRTPQQQVAVLVCGDLKGRLMGELNSSR